MNGIYIVMVDNYTDKFGLVNASQAKDVHRHAHSKYPLSKIKLVIPETLKEISEAEYKELGIESEVKMSSRIIATGGSSKTADDAIEFLKEMGAKVENSLGIVIIQLPEAALLERGSSWWENAICFYDENGNYEDKYVFVELDVDANETVLYLRNDRNG